MLFAHFLLSTNSIFLFHFFLVFIREKRKIFRSFFSRFSSTRKINRSERYRDNHVAPNRVVSTCVGVVKGADAVCLFIFHWVSISFSFLFIFYFLLFVSFFPATSESDFVCQTVKDLT